MSRTRTKVKEINYMEPEIQKAGFLSKNSFGKLSICTQKQFLQRISNKKIQFTNHLNEHLLQCWTIIQNPLFKKFQTMDSMDTEMYNENIYIALNRTINNTLTIKAKNILDNQQFTAFIKNNDNYVQTSLIKQQKIGKLYLLASTSLSIALFELKVANSILLKLIFSHQGQDINHSVYLDGSIFILDDGKLYRAEVNENNVNHHSNKIYPIVCRNMVWSRIISDREQVIGLTANYYLIMIDKLGKIQRKFRTGINITNIYDCGSSWQELKLLAECSDKYHIVRIKRNRQLAQIYQIPDVNMEIKMSYPAGKLCLIEAHPKNQQSIAIYQIYITKDKLELNELIRSNCGGLPKIIHYFMSIQQRYQCNQILKICHNLSAKQQ